MKKFVMITAFVSIACLIVSSVAFNFVNKEDLNNWSIHFEDDEDIDPSQLTEFTGEQVYDFTAQDRLELRVVSGKVKVGPSTDGKLKIRVAGKVDQTKAFNLSDQIKRGHDRVRMNLFTGESDMSEDWFTINGKVSSVLPGDVQIEVEIPAEFAGLDVGGLNVDVDVENVNPKVVDLKVVNGDMEVKTVKSERLEMKSVSGDVDLVDTSALEILVNTVSGDVDFKSSLAEKYAIEFESLSGELKGKELFTGGSTQKLKVQSVSGDLEFGVN